MCAMPHVCNRCEQMAMHAHVWTKGGGLTFAFIFFLSYASAANVFLSFVPQHS